MNANQIRCENDIKIVQNLRDDILVKRVKEHVERLTEKGPIGVRRRLLSSSVRLSRSMSPSIHKMADHCIEKLGVDIPLELYVYASPQFNAACFKPEEGRLFVMFSSSLLEAFDLVCLCYEQKNAHLLFDQPPHRFDAAFNWPNFIVHTRKSDRSCEMCHISLCDLLRVELTVFLFV